MDKFAPYPVAIWGTTEEIAKILDPEAVRMVLAILVGGPWPRPGSFFSSLIDTTCLADGNNLAALGAGFRDVALAVYLYKFREDGLEWLTRVAQANA